MGILSTIERLRQAMKDYAAEKTRHAPILGEDGFLQADQNWKPQSDKRRVEIMVTGDPSRVGAVADALDAAQKYLFGNKDKGEKLETRVTAFLDDCIHRSKWSRKAFATGKQARRMHCEQTRTKFADAFAHSRGDMVDDIVLIGHRFDDDFREALAQAEQLKDQGVHIHCFHTGADRDSQKAYEELANSTGGVFLQLTDQSKLNEVMPILMAHLNEQDTMEALDFSVKNQELLQKLQAKNLTSNRDAAKES